MRWVSPIDAGDRDQVQYAPSIGQRWQSIREPLAGGSYNLLQSLFLWSMFGDVFREAWLRVEDNRVTANNAVSNAMGMEGEQKVFVVLDTSGSSFHPLSA